MNAQGANICIKKNSADIGEIEFPLQDDDVDKIAIDIGGSMIKVVYFVKSQDQGGRMNFQSFAVEEIEEACRFLRQLLSRSDCKGEDARTPQVLKATGGGAYKYHELLTRELDMQIDHGDEMECLTTGLNFLVTQIPSESFFYTRERPSYIDRPVQDSELFPYMLVNIGSGVSIIKVSGHGQFERVSGTSIGGGTLRGLLARLTPARSFDEMLGMAERGNNRNVDMLVGDIYGSDYSKTGLKASTIASSLGKLWSRKAAGPSDSDDVANSLLYMVSNNIGQIAYLNAQCHGVRQIYFGGYFIRGHSITLKTLSYAIDYWSKGSMKALFLRHEGYLGCVGAFVQQDIRDAMSSSYCEIFGGQDARSQTAGTIGSIGKFPKSMP